MRDSGPAFVVVNVVVNVVVSVVEHRRDERPTTVFDNVPDNGGPDVCATADRHPLS